MDKQELKRNGQLENYLIDDDGAFISSHMTGPITEFFFNKYARLINVLYVNTEIMAIIAQPNVPDLLPTVMLKCAYGFATDSNGIPQLFLFALGVVIY